MANPGEKAANRGILYDCDGAVDTILQRVTATRDTQFAIR